MSPMLVTISQKYVTPFGKGLSSFQLLLSLGQSHVVENVKTKYVSISGLYIHITSSWTLEHCSYATLYVDYEPI
jgi:hypothetical protein